MNAKEFLYTIYLGDRGLKSILLDGWNHRVVLQIDLISRVRSASGQWDYYADEDIVDGLIVFTDVESVFFDPPGFISGDYIDLVGVEMLPPQKGDNEHQRFVAEFSTAAVVRILAGGVHLEDPARPGLLIRD